MSVEDIFYGSDLEKAKLHEALARSAQYWKEDEVDLSVVVAGVKKVLVLRSEVTALDRVGTSIEKYFALNARIDRVFGESRGCFFDGLACIITVELMVGLHPPEFKAKVATALEMKGSWKEHPDLLYSVAREVAEAWETAEQADRLRCRASRQC